MAITPIIFILHFFSFIPMKILFIAWFGPIPNDLVPSKKLYSEDLEIRFNEYEGGYMNARKIEG